MRVDLEYAVNHLFWKYVKRSTRDRIWVCVYTSVGDFARYSVRDSVFKPTYDVVWDSVYLTIDHHIQEYDT